MKSTYLSTTAAFATTLCLGLHLGTSAMPAAARDAGASGNSRNFQSECVGGTAVIGFSMRSGLNLDAIVPICIALNNERTGWRGEAYEPGKYFGGAGGIYQKVACNHGDIVESLVVRDGYFSKLYVVKSIAIRCRDLDSDRKYEVEPKHGGGIKRILSFDCKSDEIASGIYGWHGDFVDNLGLICQPMPARPPAPSKGTSGPSFSSIVDGFFTNASSAGACINAFHQCRQVVRARFGRAAETECASRLQACQTRAAGTPTGGRTARVVQPVQVFNAPGGNGAEIDNLEVGEVVSIVSDAGEDWFEVAAARIRGGRGFVYSGPSYRSLRME